ncbi:MAG TPA: hypothetical protein DCX17_04445 [Firmicutes bacterium]|nr:hypothetical protein [Bacillota bacterium]
MLEEIVISKVDTAVKLEFKDAPSFHAWLTANASTHPGIWIIWQKKKQNLGITYSEALEEALCFGWIDGVVKSIDANTYIRYFSKRNPKSNFSDKNRNTIEKLIADKRMTPLGYESIELAKKTGHYQKGEFSNYSPEQYHQFIKDISSDEQALSNFKQMNQASLRAYILFVSSAKLAETRARRLAISIARLHDNLPLPQ